MAPINRITLFKVPSAEARQNLLELYKDVSKTNSKDGKPYILSITAGEAFPDARSQGFNFAIQTTFSSKEDMVYYDTECEAHKKLKETAGSTIEAKMVVYFEAAPITGSL